MTDDTFFTVRPENEPTEEMARARASQTWSRWMKNSPSSFREKDRASYIEDNWEDHLQSLRAILGEACDTVPYDECLTDFGTLMTVKEFRECVGEGGFIDYDGFGCPVKDNKMADFNIFPSIQHLIPKDATHILWFNR